MAAVTSLIMLMSWNICSRFQNLNMIRNGKFLFCSLKGFWSKTILKKLLFSIFLKFDRYFNGRFLVKCTIYAYIRVQRVKISKNRHFVFEFTSLPVLTVFSTVILTRRWWRRLLKCNPKPSKTLEILHTKFEENRMKTVAVTVLPFLASKWRPWRHHLC